MKNLFAFLCLITPLALYAQNNTFDEMKTEYGGRIKYADTEVQTLLSLYYIYPIKTGVRYSFNENKYYCCLMHSDGTITSTVLITYDDLVKINKALDIISTEESSDIALGSKNLVNEFRTASDLSFGYVVEPKNKSQIGSKLEAHWYIDFGQNTFKAPIYVYDGKLLVSSLKLIEDKLSELNKISK